MYNNVINGIVGAYVFILHVKSETIIHVLETII